MKCGTVALIGEPNVGKSSLVNALVGESVSITSAKANTTRDKICGIKNGQGYQIIFLDTPGMNTKRNMLDKYMGKQISSSVAQADVICYCMTNITDAEIEKLKNYENRNIIVVVNKIDTTSFEKLYPKLTKLNDIGFIKAVVAVSAKTGKNLDVLEAEIVKLLPAGEAQFTDEDLFTTQSQKTMAAEIIRKNILELLDKEIPHGVGVQIIKWNEAKRTIEIDADILCDKPSHKPIILGKKGDMIRKIGSMCRIELQKTLNAHIQLNLFVKVKEDWRNNTNILGDLGYI